ncbi:MAG TPA: OmpA family protein, partial [Candidatus Latescibacteria bacterium]|nr:OmpA family protein [Candidatus Latescibacterota bacterium]
PPTEVEVYMERQADEITTDLRSVATVQRTGEQIKITFGSGVLFGPGSAALTAQAQESIAKLAAIIKKYPDTNLRVEGHTDSDGAEASNQRLSERRANAVAEALRSNGIPAARVTAIGYGETRPVGSNDTPEGKAANRRVEITVTGGAILREGSSR